jgi:DDE family transposase
VNKNIETLATALYVKIDDMLKDWPDLAPPRPASGIAVTLSDAELLTLAVMSALLGFTSERRWLRFVNAHLAGMFPRRIGQSGYNKRMRKAFFLFICVIRMLAMDTSLWSDDVWVVDSTPVECGRSRETARRSDAAGWAEYGYCASHSRYFWGLRLHLVCTLHGLPVLFALAGAKAGEREVLLGMLETGKDVVAVHPGQTLIGDKNYFGRDFEADLTERELVLLRPVRKGEARRAGLQLLKPLRQVIESVNWTLKGQLDLERHGGRTPEGILARVLARILALTAAIWYNDKAGRPVKRSLTAFDH